MRFWNSIKLLLLFLILLLYLFKFLLPSFEVISSHINVVLCNLNSVFRSLYLFEQLINSFRHIVLCEIFNLFFFSCYRLSVVMQIFFKAINISLTIIVRTLYLIVFVLGMISVKLCNLILSWHSMLGCILLSISLGNTFHFAHIGSPAISLSTLTTTHEGVIEVIE